MRIYLPTTIAGLQALRGTGFRPPTSAHAVTDGLRAGNPDADQDELEYLACRAAVRAVVAGSGACEANRRVVVAADVPDRAVRVEANDLQVPSLVRLLEPVIVDDVVSFMVDDDTSDDLLWFDVSELDDVLRLQ